MQSYAQKHASGVLYRYTEAWPNYGNSCVSTSVSMTYSILSMKLQSSLLGRKNDGDVSEQVTSRTEGTAGKQHDVG